MDLQEELELISNTFIANGYPPEKVDFVVNTYKPEEKEKDCDSKCAENEEVYDTLCIPYVKGTSEHLERALKKHKVRVIYKKGKTVGALLCNNKARKPDRKNVIYKGKCKTCGMIYIGETAQWLHTRVDQHKQCCKKKDEKNGFALHLKQYPDHEIDWENFEVIDSAKNWKERKIKESIYIQKQSNGGDLERMLNIENGEKMDTCWTSVLSLIN